ncbi:MAG: CHASE2 domain-containing protein [Spirochaetales bacterium]|nr:CHASE2 domain-containing protein [Spirochaetales bacterium]
MKIIKKTFNNSSWNRSILHVILGLLIGCVMIVISHKTILLDNFEKLLYDSLFFLREQTTEEIVSGEKNQYIPKDIVFTAIDDESIAVLGKWPWPRNIHGQLLENLERFGIQSAFFDILFANPEQMPDSLRESIGDDVKLLAIIEAHYDKMDNIFAEVLGESDNDFIASKLTLEETSPADSRQAAMHRRLESIPAPAETEVLFKGVLPLWPPFVNSAQPLIVNQYLDSDGTVRSCPLLFPYNNHENEPRYYLSAALSLVIDYLRAEPEDIEIADRYLIIHNAKIPAVDKKTGTFRLFRMDIDSLESDILDDQDNFNTNLYNFLLNEYGYFYPDSDMPALPLPVRLEKTGNGFKLLEGREIIEAAKTLGVRNISVILYEAGDFKISHRLHSSGNPFTFLINYAGSEQVRYKNPYTNAIEVHSPVTTVSYADIADGGLPELPDLTSNSIASLSLDKYKTWFTSYCRKLGIEQDQNLLPEDIFDGLQAEYSKKFRTLYGTHVFIGYQSRGVTYDILQTPYDTMFGTHVLINAVSTIISGNQLHPLPLFQEILLVLLLGAASAFLYSRFPLKLRGIIFASEMILLYFACYILFARFNRIVNMSLILSSQTLLFVSSTLLMLLFEEKDKRFYQSTFSRYLSPEVIEALYKSGEHPRLGGESQTITAFFSDIEGFTTISEAMEPKMLVDFLNTYLSAMTKIISENQGTLDKYIGDAIVAFFGAPYHYDDTPLKAVTTALLLQRRLEELKKVWADMEAPWPQAAGNLRMRIGLNTGNIITGNIGSYLRMDYTMIGDDVNLASRLESAAKQYGLYTLMSEKTYLHEFICNDGKLRCVRDFVHARFIDRIIVMGRSKPVNIYEPLYFTLEENKPLENLINNFSAGMNKYRLMNWTGAITEFEKSAGFEIESSSGINPSLKYIDRCRHYQEDPPAEKDGKWDGVFTLKNK